MEAALSILQYRPNNKQFIIKQILFLNRFYMIFHIEN